MFTFCFVEISPFLFFVLWLCAKYFSKRLFQNYVNTFIIINNNIYIYIYIYIFIFLEYAKSDANAKCEMHIYGTAQKPISFWIRYCIYMPFYIYTYI